MSVADEVGVVEFVGLLVGVLVNKGMLAAAGELGLLLLEQPAKRAKPRRKKKIPNIPIFERRFIRGYYSPLMGSSSK